MSKITIKMCDIRKCRVEATQHLDEFMSYYQITNSGPEIYVEKDVDLCGTHYYEYKLALPDMRIERK